MRSVLVRPFQLFFAKRRLLKTQRKELYKKRLLAVRFFDFTRNCPEEIVDCEKKRKDYIYEITRREKVGGCRSCDLPFIQEMIVLSFELKSK